MPALTPEAADRRMLVDALRDVAAVSRELRDVIRTLCDKVDRLDGREPDERPSRFVGGAMGDNGR